MREFGLSRSSLGEGGRLFVLEYERGELRLGKPTCFLNRPRMQKTLEEGLEATPVNFLATHPTRPGDSLEAPSLARETVFFLLPTSFYRQRFSYVQG
jgi:hypothetical protein